MAKQFSVLKTNIFYNLGLDWEHGHLKIMHKSEEKFLIYIQILVSMDAICILMMNGFVYFVQLPPSILFFYLLLRTFFVLLIHVLIHAGRQFTSGKHPSSLGQTGKKQHQH